MDLTQDCFTKSFEDSEVVSAPLETMGGGIIYIRSLSYGDTNRFKRLVEDTLLKRKYALFGEIDEDRKYDFAEEYLIEKYLCDKNGKPYFDNHEDFVSWKEKVKPQVAREIISHIHKNNKLYKDVKTKEEANEIAEESKKEFKKKLK